MDNEILLRLEEYNPWLRDPALWPDDVDRFLPDRIIDRQVGLDLRRDRVALVIGPRQAGKSTRIWLALRELAAPPLLIDLDDPLMHGLCASGAHLLSELRRQEIVFSALFFEEVQQLQEAGLFLKSLVDLRPGVPIAATGSASHHLAARTRESLAGRARRETLLPFSLAEVIAHRMGTEPPHRRALVTGDAVDEMLCFGGYPEVWLAESPHERRRLLLDLVQSFLLRDASDRYRVRNLDAFRTVMRLAATQVGNLINRAEYASVAEVSGTTVAEYLELMAESHVLRLVPPFLGGKRAEVTSRPKVFFVDNGLRNFLHGGFASVADRADLGPLMENLVFGELAKTLGPLDELRFWRTRNGAEVDFVVRHEEQLLAIEVKGGAMGRPRISRASRSFIEAYRPARFLVVNQTLRAESRVAETEVTHGRVEDVARWVVG